MPLDPGSCTVSHALGSTETLISCFLTNGACWTLGRLERSFWPGVQATIHGIDKSTQKSRYFSSSGHPNMQISSQQRCHMEWSNWRPADQCDLGEATFVLVCIFTSSYSFHILITNTDYCHLQRKKKSSIFGLYSFDCSCIQATSVTIDPVQSSPKLTTWKTESSEKWPICIHSEFAI